MSLLNDYITGFATILLALITSVYVYITLKILKTSQGQLQLQREQYNLENRPWLFVSRFQRPKFSEFDIKVENCGNLPAIINNCSFIIYHNNASFYDTKYLMKNNTIFPGQLEVGFKIKLDPSSMTYTKDHSEKYTVNINLKYYSATDKEKKYEYSFYGVYTVSNIDENIELIESRAE